VPQDRDPEERVSLNLDPETALQALLKVDPDAEPVEDEEPDRDDSEPDADASSDRYPRG